jgi:5'-deoxynucleotidase YfbR-like HD superfamily hydrolase
MSEKETNTTERVQEAHDSLMKIGQITVEFAGVERAVHYPYGKPENDVEHSFHLALSATEMASTYHPELNTGLVAEFSLVHDLVEIKTGDVPTFNITDEQRQQKEQNEKDALEELITELPPHIGSILQRYEEQVEPEARFVRFIDKLLPAIIHSVATEANREVFKATYKLTSVEDVLVSRDARTAQLKKMFPEFDFIHIVRELVSQTSRERIFGES